MARLLTRPLALHDVRDLESHVRVLLDTRLEEWGATLDATLYEDALAYLLAKAWELGLRYRPTPTLSFSTFSRRILRVRLVDWYRLTFGDARYGLNGREVSLDALVERWERNDGSGASDSYLDHRSPGWRLDFVDELHRGAYADAYEDTLTRAAIGL